MFQTLVIVASIVVLSAAILTSTLVSAKNAFHQLVVAKTQTAMNDATSQFQFWAQTFVATYGTEADWTAKDAQQAPIFRPMCPPATTPCTFYETLQWKVTGATVGVPAQGGSAGQTMSTASNMTPAVDEQRISATVTVVVSDASGRTIFGGRSTEVTARVFDVSPYVVVTGTKDLGSSSGVSKFAEGDTSGHAGLNDAHVSTTPNVSAPFNYTDTVVRATIDCANTPLFDEANPRAPEDDGEMLVDTHYHPDGSLIWAYQMSCTPTTMPSPPGNIPNYLPPNGNVYEIDSSDTDASWRKGDDDTSSFAR